MRVSSAASVSLAIGETNPTFFDSPFFLSFFPPISSFCSNADNQFVVEGLVAI